ncbi:uncharacterized protein M6B38_319845 [Iris pallida]|uniref:Sulfite exporter TauE/SafE family protein 3-like n=1 Tax=Iris pallida TaxID=29817 RepID=A0AAX6HC60_IRIPA|nr:uncharacterized protein M6B38_319845 [Iris pallida]
MDAKWRNEYWSIVLACLLAVAVAASAETALEDADDSKASGSSSDNFFRKIAHFLWQPEQTSYHHVWPRMRFGWKIIIGAMIGFVGAAFGSVGGVGGGGIFVPMLTLVIGFDPKSATAISKCMIMGAAGSTVYYNMRQRHPTLDMPIIDYDLALLFQPMLMLGVSIGVALNVIFANWMVTILLIIIFLGISIKAFKKGLQTWKKETLMKKEAAARLMQTNGIKEKDHKDVANGTLDNASLKKSASTADRVVVPVQEDEATTADDRMVPVTENDAAKKSTPAASRVVPILQNVRWKQLGLVLFVWGAFLVLQITKAKTPNNKYSNNFLDCYNYTSNCSKWYWTLNMLQIPVSAGVSLYQAVALYKGKAIIASKGDKRTDWTATRLFLYCLCGILAGLVGGLLGLGGGTILGPLFLELGVPPQVSSATTTFSMLFSSSMSVVEYYLLKRFPVPYASYFVAVALISALVGQHAVGKLIKKLGRASLIVFVLASTIFISALLLGGVGLEKMVKRIDQHEYMGFSNICKYET